MSKKPNKTTQYKIANEKFLEEKAIDGTIFDTTDGQPLPAFFRVRDLIVGWQAALTRMHTGDKYEIFIPARYGYGSARMDDIPAYSTLIFTLELLKIQ